MQQEELRTANEELEEQSRVLEESQTNLENQQAELEQTNDQLAEQAIHLDARNVALNEAQIELRQRAAELERASRYKSEFLANMSHELRTPLNSSLILAKLLSDNAKGNLSEEQVKFAQTIYSAGNDLLHLINDILDISKVEAGKLELVLESLTVRRMVEGLAMTFEPLAMQKQLRFVVQVEPSVPATVWSDRQRLEQVLEEPVVECGEIYRERDGDPDRQQHPGRPRALCGGRFRHRHFGRPAGEDFRCLPPGRWHHQPPLWRHRPGPVDFARPGRLAGRRDYRHEFAGQWQRVHPDPAPHLSGAVGRGRRRQRPAPCRRAGPASGAPHQPACRAAAQRRQRQPAVSRSRAPAADAASFPDDRNLPASEHERSVLVIEDDPAFADILYKLAREMRYRCLVALTGTEGLQLAAEFLPDAVLLDMRLPDRSGLSVLQLLKDNPDTRHIPVHVVSSNDNGGEALTLGAIGYALKPSTREELEQVFKKLEEKFTQKIKRILLVEDDERQRDSVVALIARQRRRDCRRRFRRRSAGPAAYRCVRLHDHRPQAARYAGQ